MYVYIYIHNIHICVCARFCSQSPLNNKGPRSPALCGHPAVMACPKIGKNPENPLCIYGFQSYNLIVISDWKTINTQ